MKDFKNWHNKKSKINNIENRPFFHEKEVWFCYFGVNVGFEQDGANEEFLRPVLIVKKFNNNIFLGIPLTKANKKQNNKKTDQYYYQFSFIKDFVSVAILSQIRLLDAKRLSHHIGYINKEDFKNLTKKLKALIP